jgi:hypothetical protein
MDVLNQQFMADPLGFMKKFPMRTDAALDKPLPVSPGPGVAQGLRRFDLEYDKVDKNVVVITLYERPVGKDSHEILAWWLPWKSGAAVTMKLSKGAEFFFTSSVGGCRLQYSGGAEPVVSHIAGDTGGGDDDGSGPGGSAWRDRKSAEETGKHRGMVRTLSSSDVTSPSLYGQTGLGIFVAYKKSGSWRFIMQAQDMSDGHRVIVKTSETLG